MKVLLTASVLSHICQFHKPLMNMLKVQGHTVHVAAYDNLAEKNGLSLENVDQVFNIAFHRNPFSPQNITAYRKLKSVIETGQYDIIHCNTPAVGVLTRLGARASRKKNGTKVFYTAHGFHFYRGASKKNWLMYYPIEKFMCRYTDMLVTITEEDYELAKKRFRVNTFHMHGVGASSARFTPVNEEEKNELRHKLALTPEDHIILCTGELLPNKNQATLIKAVALLVPRWPNLKVLLAGNGPEESNLRSLIEMLNLESTVSLLGYKTNIHEYVKAADIIVSCSFREGLPLNIIEAMLSGKPVVASINRGHRELVVDAQTGYLVEANAPDKYAEAIEKLLSDTVTYRRMAEACIGRGCLFADTNIIHELEELYNIHPTKKE